VHVKSVAIPAIICALVIALMAGVLAVWPGDKELHAVAWIRPDALASESILLFDNDTFEASFSFDVGPASKSIGTWHKREDLKTEEVITLEPTGGSAKFVNDYGQLFVRTLGTGEKVLVPGMNVASFDAGEKFSESAAFHQKVVTTAR
jgi:hypothetical protein